MGNERYLIDTNVAIEYVGGLLPEKAMKMLDGIIDDKFYFSVINKIELLGFSGISKNEEEIFQKFINAANVLGLYEDVVNQTIFLRKKHKIKIPDAIIAATALVNNLVLLTRNTKDFKSIDNLKVVNMHEV